MNSNPAIASAWISPARTFQTSNATPTRPPDRISIGRFSDGTTTDRSIPAPVTSLPSGATAVAAAHYQSLAVVNGSVYGWGVSQGYSTTPVLIDPANLTNIVAVAASVQGTASYALSSDGRLWRWSDPTFPGIEELLPPAGYKFTSISAGGGSALATLRAVPEPSAFILAAAAFGLCIARRRSLKGLQQKDVQLGRQCGR